MASLHKRGRYWHVSFSVLNDNPDRKSKYKVVSKSTRKENKEEAKIMAAQWELDKQKGILPLVSSKISFRDFVENEYLKWSKANKSNGAFMSNVYSCKALMKFLGTYQLSAITPYVIEQYKIKRKEDIVKERTINIEIGCIKQMFRLAEEWGFILKNPARKVLKYREPKRFPRYLTIEEIYRLVHNATPWSRMYILIGLGTGMRNGEILNLRIKNIALDRNLIFVKSDIDSGFMVKNRSDRVIPIISPGLCSEIRWFMHYRIDDKTFETSERTSEQMDYLFCDSQGKPIKSMDNAFRGAVKRAGLTNVSPHTLRHTYGSHLAMNRVDMRTIQELMGHSNIKTTEIYTQISQQHKEDTLKKIEYSNAFDRFIDGNEKLVLAGKTRDAVSGKYAKAELST